MIPIVTELEPDIQNDQNGTGQADCKSAIILFLKGGRYGREGHYYNAIDFFLYIIFLCSISF